MGSRGAAVGQVEVFQYVSDAAVPPEPVWEGWGEPPEPAGKQQEATAHDHGESPAEVALRAEFEKRLAEEGRKSYEAGREKGRQEGRQAEHEAQAAGLAALAEQRTRQAAKLVEGFALERDRFLQAVEQEVVELALAVAARILRREAQMDPLLLTGAVRVALGQLSGSTEVKLLVPAEDVALWTEAMALVPNLTLKPQVSVGEGMRLGDCVLETRLGSVDLGVRTQLGEIERGFFDRPGRRAAPGQEAGAEKQS